MINCCASKIRERFASIHRASDDFYHEIPYAGVIQELKRTVQERKYYIEG
jgi:hypothetical protein